MKITVDYFEARSGAGGFQPARKHIHLKPEPFDYCILAVVVTLLVFVGFLIIG